MYGILPASVLYICKTDPTLVQHGVSRTDRFMLNLFSSSKTEMVFQVSNGR